MMSWWRRLAVIRLRNKVIAWFLAVVVPAVIGTAYITTRNFVADKREYILVLNSIAAPTVASALSKHLDYLHGQLVVFDDILASMQQSGGSAALIQSSFKNLNGVLRLDVFDKTGLVATVGADSSEESLARYPKGAADQLKAAKERWLIAGAGGHLRAMTWVRGHLYAALLEPARLSELFDLAKPLAVRLVTDDGASVAGGDASAGLEPAILSLPKERQTVIAKELRAADGSQILVAVAPIPGARGLAVVTHAPMAEVSKLAAIALRKSLPFVVLILLLAISLGVALSAQLTRPIEELTEATSHIAAGSWKVSIRAQSRDEIGRLVVAFSRMGSELAEREAQLKKAHEDLLRSERLAALGKFGAGMAHEIKNPLNSILGYSQLIQRELGEGASEKVRKYLSFIMDETRRASRTITDLLIFARQRAPTLQPESLSEAIRHARELILPQAQAAGVALNAEIGDSEVRARIDRDQFYQVLLNLCTNAFQAMEGRDMRAVTIALRREGSQAVVEVSDTGSGIPEENLAKVFEPFFSTKGVGKGTGLGLSLCLGIVQEHHGKIELDSKVGEGTRFRISLPAEEA